MGHIFRVPEDSLTTYQTVSGLLIRMKICELMLFVFRDENGHPSDQKTAGVPVGKRLVFSENVVSGNFYRVSTLPSIY